MSASFTDRHHAGRLLAAALAHHRGAANLVVLGLPRGGVPVAAEVASALGAPLDVVVVRKLGAPGHAELAVGAIATGGVRVLNDGVVRSLRVDDAALDEIEERETRELLRRESSYRGDRPPLDVAGLTVVLVDDGVATGATMLVALRALRQRGARRLIAAVPVGAPDSLERLRTAADEVVCLLKPPDLVSVGQWYDDFSQTTDAEVAALLKG
ncbi:MAG TPA: phosphoribosyltransferase [Trueperaceae bacterium]|nr:phosphoribosyltransferase [Trueperaceae bacterium]